MLIATSNFFLYTTNINIHFFYKTVSYLTFMSNIFPILCQIYNPCELYCVFFPFFSYLIWVNSFPFLHIFIQIRIYIQIRI